MADRLRELLLQHNPWLPAPARQAELLLARRPSPFIPRARRAGLSDRRVTLVIGPRQAGKSTFLLEAAREQRRPLVLLNAEEPAFRPLCRSPGGFLAWLEREVVATPAFLVFEEVQHLEEAGLFLKGLVDLRSGHHIAATGSSSYHLRARTRESLAGRAERLTILPFSHAELMPEEDLPPIGRDLSARAIWERQLRVGGFPDAWHAERPEGELARLVESFVVRDASDLYRVQHLDAFRTILRLAAADQGQLVNLSAWAAEAGVSRATAAHYLDLLEETHVLRRVRPFLGGKRAEIKASFKVYFVDNGVRNILFGGLGDPRNRADAGALAEGWVFGELLKNLGLLDTIRYWRTRNGSEVDFVVERPGQRIAIEVKAGALREPRLPRAARTFLGIYRPDRFLLVNAELRERREEDGVPVDFCLPWEVAGLLAPAG